MMSDVTPEIFEAKEDANPEVILILIKQLVIHLMGLHFFMRKGDVLLRVLQVALRLILQPAETTGRCHCIYSCQKNDNEKSGFDRSRERIVVVEAFVLHDVKKIDAGMAYFFLASNYFLLLRILNISIFCCLHLIQALTSFGYPQAWVDLFELLTLGHFD